MQTIQKVIGFIILIVLALFMLALLSGCTTGNVNGLRKPTTPTVQPTQQPTQQPEPTQPPVIPTPTLVVVSPLQQPTPAPLPTATPDIQGFAAPVQPEPPQGELQPCDTAYALPVTVEPDGEIRGEWLHCAYETAVALNAGK
jgi:hypothetical protein